MTGGSTNSGGYSTQPVQSVAPVRITKPLCESIRIGMSWKDLDSIFGTKGKPMVVGGGAEIKGYVSNGKPEGIFFWIISGGSAAATYQDGILKKFECYYDGGSISIK